MGSDLVGTAGPSGAAIIWKRARRFSGWTFKKSHDKLWGIMHGPADQRLAYIY